MDRADPLDQPGVGELAVRRRPALPGVEPGAGDAEHPTEQRDRVVGLLRRDEPEHAHRVSLSRAKRAAAFFQDLPLLLEHPDLAPAARSSVRSPLVRPFASPASIADCLTHSRNDSDEVVRDLPQRAAADPVQRDRLTPKLRRVRLLEVRSPWHGRTSSSPDRTVPTKRSGVHESGGIPLSRDLVSWAHLGSNQGPPACEAGALPLSYAPGRGPRIPTRRLLPSSRPVALGGELAVP